MIAKEKTLTLADMVWSAANVPASLLRGAVLALAGSALLTLSAKIQIPFWPVPFTMQTFVVLMIGMVYGSRLAGVTLLLYLAEGAVGLPVFAKGGGIAYFAGPTGGYLLGFLLAATLTGWLAERGWGRSAKTAVLAMLAGNIVVYLAGVPWLGYQIGFGKALAVGLVPFLPSDILKIIAAAVLLPVCWRLVGKPDK